MSLRRIAAVVLRQAYLYRRSFPRLMEIFYWPLVDLLLWGFVTVYLMKASSDLPRFVSFFIGALILWDVLFRAQQGINVSFLEDMWARNLVNIFVSPLRMYEYLAGLLVISVLKVVVAFSVMSAMAGLIYSFNIFKLGLALLPLFLNLAAMGWAIGILTMALTLRFGQEAEVLAWAVAFLFMPFSAVFYPVDVLPPVLQGIAAFLPSAHAFEGMRAVINGGPMPVGHILKAAGLNIVFLLGASGLFVHVHRHALLVGSIPKIGE